MEKELQTVYISNPGKEHESVNRPVDSNLNVKYDRDYLTNLFISEEACS